MKTTVIKTSVTISPDNASTSENPVGHFMVAVGAILRLKETNLILTSQRAATLDWRPNTWELSYGRIAQHEDPRDGLRRELKEELGLTQLEVFQPLRVWHIYRGTVAAENDLIGITFLCETTQKEIHLSAEHQAYAWVTPEQAREKITEPGIREDIENYLDYVNKRGVFTKGR